MEGKIIGRLMQKEVVDWVGKQTRPFRDLMACYRCAIMETETKFNVLNEELSLEYDRNPIESIKSRLKSPTSVFEKLRRKNLEPTVENIEQNIFDVAGIRVICSFPEDIYMLADCLLRQDDVHLIARKDYIQDPKPNGYRSLHLIIEIPIFLHDEKKFMKVEVQLRTIAMDCWASLEHKIRYKKNLPDDNTIEQELRECAEISALLDKKMDRVRKRLEDTDAYTRN